MPADEMTAGGASSQEVPKSKQVVCTACRQSKLRCIGPNTSACARCARLGLECFRDASFKRISKSRKIAELEKQVRHLSDIVQTGGPSNYSPGYQIAPDLALPDSPQAGVINNGTTNQRAIHDEDVQDFNSGLSSINPPAMSQPARTFNDSAVSSMLEVGKVRPKATISQEIETVRINPKQIDNLFQIFFDHYHFFLPFLDVSKSPDEYQKQSPCLFWAIISVASRRYREDVTLLTVLSGYVSKIIWGEISKPPYNVSTVQAIVVLCTWPFPTTSTWNEPAVTMSSVAVSIAMQVGLHRPMNAQDFLRTKTTVSENDLRTRTSTWAAANMVSQLLGATVGQLPTAPFDWTIDQACLLGSSYTLPEDLRLKLIISRYCDRITRLMCGNSNESMSFQSPSDRITFLTSWENDMAMLENELYSLEQQHQQHFSMIDRVYCAAARVYLHSFYFFDSSNSQTRKLGILKAYKSACNFISLLTDADKRTNLLRYLSYYHFRMFLTSACILLKVLSSSYADDVEDYEAGKKLFNQTIFAMSRATVFNDDIGGKAIKLLAQVWHSRGDNRRQSPPELIIKSRLGASLTYDFIWTWRQEFGGVPRAYPSPSVTGSQPQESPLEFIGLFQDASMVDMDFLDNPNWNLGVEESSFI